jgi:subtilisin
MTGIGSGGNPNAAGKGQSGGPAETTGRYVLVLGDELQDDEAASMSALRSVLGVTTIASTSDFESRAVDLGEARAADATFFGELGIAVVAADPDRVAALRRAVAADPRTTVIEPERVLHAITYPTPLSTVYLEGFRDAASHLYEHAAGNGVVLVEAESKTAFADSPTFTWGLQATNASSSSQAGRGVSLAVLDTGFDLDHPDFAGRNVAARSFVPGEPAQDRNGHGTHCVGTSCGSASPSTTRRYGVAAGSDILVGKVLSDEGSGTDTGILAGMSWGIANGCRVISMSLGADIRTVSTAYETVGRRALDSGVLIVAAAGNNAVRRFGDPGFVGVPANSPSVMSVAAIDSRLEVADFSAQSNPVAGGQIDVSGPGVAVYSSWPLPRRYETINGTSMATPHVAGIAALWSAATGATGRALWTAVQQAARRLPAPSVDVGVGLVQAPI